MDLPVLYNIDAKGTERFWRTWFEGDVVYTEYGVVGGKPTQASRTFTGKNVGKKSETTAEEQARLECQRGFSKQLDKDYHAKGLGVKLEEKIRAEKMKHGGRNANSDAAFGEKGKFVAKRDTSMVIGAKTMKPMLCHKWEETDKCEKYFDFDEGVYIQPKLDGWRCLAMMHGDDVILHTRNGKQYPFFANIRKDVKRLLGAMEPGTILDGELYSYALFNPTTGEEVPEDAKFQAISSTCAVSNSVPTQYDSQMNYFIYDIANTELTQKERFRRLEDGFESGAFGLLYRVETLCIHKKSELRSHLDRYISDGFEGIILRSSKLMYKSTRSMMMRKYKLFEDDEFEIVGFKSGEGVEEGCVVWVCKDDEGRTFDVRPKGTHEERKKLYKKGSTFIGQKLTVRFQEKTADGIPRFPVGIGIREDID